MDEVPDRACHIFDGHVRVDAMLVEDVDMIGPEAFQSRICDVADALGAAVETVRWHTVPEAELRGDHHMLANGLQRLSYNLLIETRPISLGGVEKGDTTGMGGANETNCITVPVACPYP